MMHQGRLAARTVGEYPAVIKGARVQLCSPLTYTVCQPPAYRGEWDKGGEMYYVLLISSLFKLLC